MMNSRKVALLAVALMSIGTATSVAPVEAQGNNHGYGHRRDHQANRSLFRQNIGRNAFQSPYAPNALPFMPQIGAAPVWNLSAAGGYYDQTGSIAGVVPGSELFRYGGTFYDGRPVPTGPVNTNAAGHVLY